MISQTALWKITRLMKDRGIGGSKEMARRARVSADTVQMIMTTSMVPGADDAVKIARVLASSVESIWGMSVTLKMASDICTSSGFDPPLEAALLWVIPDLDHDRAAARRLVEEDRSTYLKRLGEMPYRMTSAGIVTKWVRAEISLNELDETLHELGLSDDAEGRAQALVTIARRRGLML